MAVRAGAPTVTIIITAIANEEDERKFPLKHIYALQVCRNAFESTQNSVSFTEPLRWLSDREHVKNNGAHPSMALSLPLAERYHGVRPSSMQKH